MATKNKRPKGADISYRPTAIHFVLDETGSMTLHKAATIAGYNTFISEQREQAGQCLLTLTKFEGGNLNTPFVDLDLSMVLPMTSATFIPGGLTNLRDAIGQSVRSLEERLVSWTVTPNVLVIVMTDGGDNVSREYSEPQIRDLIKSQEAEGWTFVFLGACTSALDIAEKLGFQKGNSKQFDAAAMEEVMTQVSAATTVYRAARADAQATSENCYFV